MGIDEILATIGQELSGLACDRAGPEVNLRAISTVNAGRSEASGRETRGEMVLV